jgi:CheY-like chemotaxis protein
MTTESLPPICVIDDDEDIRLTLRFLLEDAGYTVHDDATGGGALEHLRAQEDCTVVLLDMVMPGGGGLDVLRAFDADRALAAKHAVMLITATPNIRDAEALALIRRLNVPILGKPFDIDDLRDMVRAAAARVRASATGCEVR